MKFDSSARGRSVAALFLEHSPRLFADLVESDVGQRVETLPGAAVEWEIFALYACVRGLVAAGGFNRETAAAIEVMHEAVAEDWARRLAEGETLESRHATVAQRYEEYGSIGQEGGKAGAATVSFRLGEAAARHMLGEPADPELSELVGTLHESLAEAVTAQLRSA